MRLSDVEGEKMEDATNSSIMSELWNSIKYAIESKQGKYDLDTYLDIVGEYADRLIAKAEKEEKILYQGGNCEVTQQENIYQFTVKLYFKAEDRTDVLKEASRKIEKKRFTSETMRMLEQSKTFEILKG